MELTTVNSIFGICRNVSIFYIRNFYWFCTIRTRYFQISRIGFTQFRTLISTYLYGIECHIFFRSKREFTVSLSNLDVFIGFKGYRIACFNWLNFRTRIFTACCGSRSCIPSSRFNGLCHVAYGSDFVFIGIGYGWYR